MTSELPPPAVLHIGACHSPQFRRVFSEGGDSDLLESAQSHIANSILEAISLIDHGQSIPDLVVCYQSIPDEYTSTDIERLIGMLPLCRFVVVFSPWCESIGRTEQHWPSAWSVPLEHAPARIRFELQQLAAAQPPLLATTSRDEAFSTLAAGSLTPGNLPGREQTARVISEDVPLKECFENILSHVGFNLHATELPDLHVVAAAFIDQKQICRIKELHEEQARSRELDASRNETIILVATDMATPHDRTRLLEAGVTAVISQLRFAEDLTDHFSPQLLTGVNDSEQCTK